ncbi:MAG: cobalamin-dependent protein [Chitinispirillaceae bacterium]|nr:cobalamin-dependent protein [Chitinispirillaceae bacterium]
MKILFLCSETKQLGVGYLVSSLRKHGHQAAVIVDPLLLDNEFVRVGKINRSIAEKKWKDICDSIQKLQPDLIGLSVNTANIRWALEKAALVKSRYNAPIIFGGPHPTILPEETLHQEAVDMVAIGEAEETIVEYAEHPAKTDIAGMWFKKEGTVIRNQVRPLRQNIDEYPWPADEAFYCQLPPTYRWYPDVLSGRGCPYGCSFCSNASRKDLYAAQQAGGRWVRQRSVDGVIKELMWRKKKHGSRLFDFKNEVFAINDDWLRDFSRDYRRHVALPFYCYYSLNLAAVEERVRLLKEAGCRAVHFGLQSGSESVRREILFRHERNAEALEGARNCHKYELNFSVHCLLDLPLETPRSLRESAYFYNALRPSDVSCYSLLYFPGAKIVDIALRAGIIDTNLVDKIKRGEANMVPRPLRPGRRTSYRRFALLLTSIPLMPSGSIDWILKRPWAVSLFSLLPVSLLLPAVKFVTMWRGGWGHLMPAIIFNELYNVARHFFTRSGLRAWRTV